MTKTFAALMPSGDPVADITRFYQDMDLLDTLQHVTQVAAQARVLAEQHNLNVATAHLAALAHDLAAGVPKAEMPAVAEQMNIQVDDADRAIPGLLHGPIAAAALATRLEVHDEDILNPNALDAYRELAKATS